MKKRINWLLCLALLLTLAVPAQAEELSSSEPSGEAPVTDHVCDYKLTSDTATCAAVGVKTYT